MSQLITSPEQLEGLLPQLTGGDDPKADPWGADVLTRHMRVLSVERGRLTIEFTVAREHTNQHDTLHGGCLATLIDLIASTALLTITADAYFSLSIEQNTTFNSAAALGEKLIVVSEVTRHTQSVHTVISHSDGKGAPTGMVARGSHTYYVKRANKIASARL